MKYEIRIAWYVSRNSKPIVQTIGCCDVKEKAFRIVACVAKTISSHQTIDYNCIELRKSKHGRVFGRISIVEHLDKMVRKYGPFYTHLVVLGKPKTE